jgi:hypothetical protein
VTCQSAFRAAMSATVGLRYLARCLSGLCCRGLSASLSLCLPVSLFVSSCPSKANGQSLCLSVSRSPPPRLRCCFSLPGFLGLPVWGGPTVDQTFGMGEACMGEACFMYNLATENDGVP